MKDQLIKPTIIVKKSSIQGYGVFATQRIKPGEIIEECPILFIDKKIEGLENYQFEWEDSNKFALALGYGSIYNHSDTPNASYTFNVRDRLIIFKAKKPIAPDEEILIYYRDNWFKSRGMRVIKSKKPRTEFQDTLILLGKVLLVAGIIILMKLLTEK